MSFHLPKISRSFKYSVKYEIQYHFLEPNSASLAYFLPASLFTLSVKADTQTTKREKKLNFLIKISKSCIQPWWLGGRAVV